MSDLRVLEFFLVMIGVWLGIGLTWLIYTVSPGLVVALMVVATAVLLSCLAFLIWES